MKVRLREVMQSVNLIRRALSRLPSGEAQIKVKGFSSGEVFFRVERPRGELFYYIKAGGRKCLDRLRIRTPTFANLPALLVYFAGDVVVRCAGGRSIHRSLYQLHRKVGIGTREFDV